MRRPEPPSVELVMAEPKIISGDDYHVTYQVTINLSHKNAVHIPIEGYNLCSIQLEMASGADFSSAVIAVQKTNMSSGASKAFNAPMTISAPGYYELNEGDFVRAAYLALRVTTVSSAARTVQGVIHLKRSPRVTLESLGV